MALRQSRVAVLLLLPAGVLTGHALGYAGAGHGHASGAHVHGYLGAAAAIAAPLGLVALLASVLRPGTGSALSFRHVLVLQWGALVFQEALEHLVSGEPAGALLLSEPLWLGLTAQLAVAGGATLLLRSARAVGVRLASLPARVHVLLGAPQTTVTVLAAAVPAHRPRLTLPARAPPAVAG